MDGLAQRIINSRTFFTTAVLFVLRLTDEKVDKWQMTAYKDPYHIAKKRNGFRPL